MAPADACTARTRNSGQWTDGKSPRHRNVCDTTCQNHRRYRPLLASELGKQEDHCSCSGETENTVQQAYEAAGRMASLNQLDGSPQAPGAPAAAGGQALGPGGSAPPSSPLLPGGWGRGREGRMVGGEER